jgi:hypothetical protein
VLLVAVVLLLVAVSAGIFFGLTDEQTPAPDAAMSLEPVASAECHQLVHESGDRIDGNRLRVRGVANATVFAGREVSAGTTAEVRVHSDTVRVIWSEDDHEESYMLHTFDVDDPGAAAGTVCSDSDVLIFTGNTSGVVAVNGHGGEVHTIPNTDDVAAIGGLGPDVTGDGDRDIPYVTASETVEVVDADGETTTIADSSDIPGSIETSKTRLTTGDWNGDGTAAVFFVNQNHDTLWKATPSGSPTQVMSPGDGVQSVVGIEDVDGDGTDDLVYADASQQLRYRDGQTGSIEVVNNGQTGSNNGIGSGSIEHIGGNASIVAIDGSNDLVINQEPNGGGTTTISAVDAAKAPVTVADVDDDGEEEVVYVDLNDGRMRFVDDPLDSPTVQYLEDEDGHRIDASDESGVT